MWEHGIYRIEILIKLYDLMRLAIVRSWAFEYNIVLVWNSHSVKQFDHKIVKTWTCVAAATFHNNNFIFNNKYLHQHKNWLMLWLVPMCRSYCKIYRYLGFFHFNVCVIHVSSCIFYVIICNQSLSKRVLKNINRKFLFVGLPKTV